MQLLGSFIGARSQYALARLEYAMVHPAAAAPPLIDRLFEPTERALREDWPHLESQLEGAVAYARRLERIRRKAPIEDPSYRFLQRSLREMDQYARAIRWVLTVTESQ